MARDVFGNLLEWGNVMNMLGELGKTNQLDQHQEGLARILRYKDNWRLRETVLQCCTGIRRPENVLLDEIRRVMMSVDEYYDLRILAVTAMGALASRAPRATTEDALGSLHVLLDAPQPPILHDAVQKAIAGVASATR